MVKKKDYHRGKYRPFPAALLALPAAVSTPYMVIWLYVKDLFLVLIFNAAILLGVGVFKAVYLIRSKKHAFS